MKHDEATIHDNEELRIIRMCFYEYHACFQSKDQMLGVSIVTTSPAESTTLSDFHKIFCNSANLIRRLSLLHFSHGPWQGRGSANGPWKTRRSDWRARGVYCEATKVVWTHVEHLKARLFFQSRHILYAKKWFTEPVTCLLRVLLLLQERQAWIYDHVYRNKTDFAVLIGSRRKHFSITNPIAHSSRLENFDDVVIYM
jgi:hypothetical protein